MTTATKAKNRSANTAPEIDWAQLLETALTSPGHLGDTYCRFYDYSFLNQIWLMVQGVREPVATYNRWQSVGRQVQKGSKSKSILRPIIIKRKDENEEVISQFLRFKVSNCLFTYSETEGEELPPVVIPEWDLARALKELEITKVPYELLSGNVQGYSVGRTIAISPIATDRIMTTFHELAHIVCGHTAKEQESDVLSMHRGLKEFQAEAVAYLVGTELGVMNEDAASESRAYIQGWLHGETPNDAAIRKVFSATNAILKAGRAPRNEESEEA